MKTASILIRTKNEERALGTTLDGVFDQDLQPHEVFVIDSGSTDATLEIAARYPVRIRQISPREWNYSRALNLGAEQATGEFIVCLSAHCQPVSRSWLSTLLSHFDDPQVAASWGPSLRPGRQTFDPDPPARQEPGTYTFETRTYGLENSNSALRRSLWLEFPFNETLPATEDKAWGLEAMARGYCLVHDPRAAVWHPRNSPASAFQRNRAVLAGFIILFPELAGHSSTIVKRLPRRVWTKVRTYALNPDPRRLWLDLTNAPSVLGGILGKVLPRRRV